MQSQISGSARYPCTIPGCNKVWDNVYSRDRHMRSNHERFRVMVAEELQRNCSADSNAYLEVEDEAEALGDSEEEEEAFDGDHTANIEGEDEDTGLEAVQEPDVWEGDQAQHDPQQNSFNGGIYRIGADISQAQMRDIYNLVCSVAEVKARNPSAAIPAIDRLFKYQTRGGSNHIPELKTTKHTVVVKKKVGNRLQSHSVQFWMNAPSEYLKLLVANPQTVNKVSVLPDETEGELVESNQGQKWRTHRLFQHPMVSALVNNSMQDLWIGDLVLSGGGMFMLARFFTLNHLKLMADAFMVEYDGSSRTYYVHSHEALKLEVASIAAVQWHLSASMKPYVLPYPSNNERSRKNLEAVFSYCSFKKPSDGRVQGRQFMPVKVIPLNLFTDDMSGNRTKKFNKFDSWSMVPAALPLKQRHQLEYTNFICADHALSAMQMLPAIVDDLVLLEKGVEMMTPEGEKVLVVAPVQFITADNARHAEIAWSRGATSSRSCRKCDWKSDTSPKPDGSDYISTKRSDAIVKSMYDRFLSNGGVNPQLLVDKPRGYKLVGGQALLKLEAFDCMVDNPIGVLHTVMLGVGKALVKNLLGEHLEAEEVASLQKLLHSYDSKGFKRKLSSSLRLHNSFLGRDYKIILQQLPILLEQMLNRRQILARPELTEIIYCFESLGRLISLIYVSKITSHSSYYLDDAVSSEYGNFRKWVLQHDYKLMTLGKKSDLYHSSKMHILYHLTEDIIRFGSPIFYETEKGEQFNKFIREALFRTNRHNPSRDAAIAFGKRTMMMHIMSGGHWLDDNDIWTKASDKVLESRTTFCVNNARQFVDNNDADDKKDIKCGTTGLFGSVSGELVVGEVQRMDPVNKMVTLIPFNFSTYGRDGRIIANHFLKHCGPSNLSLAATSRRSAAGNLLVKKNPGASLTIPINDLTLDIPLDIYQEYYDTDTSSVCNLLNVSKIGAFWFILTHQLQ